MARKRMVTRTIESTKATALCLNIETAEPCNIACTLPGTYKNPALLLKAVKAEIETDTLKAVSIVDTEVESAVYGMEEAEFLRMAVKLPPRTAAEPATDND